MMHRRTDDFLHREGVSAEAAVEECHLAPFRVALERRKRGFRKRLEGNPDFQYFVPWLIFPA